MIEDSEQRLPGWGTFRSEKTVCAVAHNAASAHRLVDYIELMEGDRRICIEWTVVPDRLGSGVTRMLDRLGIEPIPWPEAKKRSYDLAVCTSLHEVEFLDAKNRFAAPHGCGYNKRYPAWFWRTNDDPPVYGLDRQSLLDRDGKPVFAALVLSHIDQFTVLAGQCPEAAHAALVGGDIAFDRLLASLPLRERYRHDFRVGRNQKLVAVSSTWGPESLLSRFPALPERLTHELPADHRVVMTMHPAVWAEHGIRSVRSYLRDAVEAGMTLLGPAVDWRAVLAAADVLVSDHTSLTPYAAGAGIPVLLSHFARDEMSDRSPINDLARHSPRLDAAKPLLGQLAEAYAVRETQQRIALGQISSVRGQSARVVRKALYRLLKLSEPDTAPRVDAVPFGALPEGW
ncbi:hypothetical protein KIPE111705_46635 [Kibdelosporangium persicum]|uniref:CDP-glycerol:poly(Glycerophosphate) glycerophosphotransferase n=1 Tax=Kibdelosporangium persicum TaxID=2698649 RepID=A0ABX2F3K0_9PSEU|nr:hypothetical protein [Kibdelosporangium persicum]NRN65914.1 CDP-glycerol:poly(Glycerophosphate) glycerophosphotransferase [Kibdelosporangium persicum]